MKITVIVDGRYFLVASVDNPSVLFYKVLPTIVVHAKKPTINEFRKSVLQDFEKILKMTAVMGLNESFIEPIKIKIPDNCLPILQVDLKNGVLNYFDTQTVITLDVRRKLLSILSTVTKTAFRTTIEDSNGVAKAINKVLDSQVVESPKVINIENVNAGLISAGPPNIDTTNILRFSKRANDVGNLSDNRDNQED